MSDINQLRLVGHITSAEEECLQTALKQWPYGCETAGEYTDELGEMDQSQKCYLVKFKRYPWAQHPVGNYGVNDSIHGQLTLQTLVNGLKKCRWSLLISNDVSTKYAKHGKDGDEYKVDCHSLFLVKTSSHG